MRPFKPGDPITVKGAGKHKKGTFVANYAPPIAGDKQYIEYRCDFNQGSHTVELSRIKHQVKHRVKKEAVEL